MDIMTLKSLAKNEVEITGLNLFLAALDKYPQDLEGRLKYYQKSLNKLHNLYLSGKISKEFYSASSLFVSYVSDSIVAIRDWKGVH